RELRQRLFEHRRDRDPDLARDDLDDLILAFAGAREQGTDQGARGAGVEDGRTIVVGHVVLALAILEMAVVQARDPGAQARDDLEQVLPDRRQYIYHRARRSRALYLQKVHQRRKRDLLVRRRVAGVPRADPAPHLLGLGEDRLGGDEPAARL